MPVYNFQCPDCRKLTGDILQSFDDPAPICCGGKMIRLIGPVSFKIWSNDNSIMDADAEARRCGVDI